jgi:WD40 repeat protein
MELKRSKMGRAAKIQSLCFSDDGTMLVVSSSSKTIHIFAIQGEKKSDRAFAFIRLDQEGISETKHISSFKPDNCTIQVRPLSPSLSYISYLAPFPCSL